MSNQFRQSPWKGQFSLSLLLLVTKLIASGFAPPPATAKTISQHPSQSSIQATISERQTHKTQTLEVTPEAAIYISESTLNKVAPGSLGQDQPQVDSLQVDVLQVDVLQIDIVQTPDGTLIAQDRRPEEEDLGEEDLQIDDLESDY
ncbi:MAG: hypothetical protein AAGF93_13645 [Cyanobacteria bacterium P01_H01_bin.105]